MQGCFPFRSHRRQPLRHGGGGGGGGGGVTVVSRGDGGARVKIVVGEDELGSIVSGVTRRQLARRRQAPGAGSTDIVQQQASGVADQMGQHQRRRPESEGGATVVTRRGECHHPSSPDGTPEEASEFLVD
uniref:Uncharacterized protein n=1 Tax=Oryza brachyantha TaxID=4533 RepID=J3N4K6_ORYBR